MVTNELSFEEYQRIFQAPMQDVTATAEPALDIWPYVDAVPLTDLKGFILLDGIVNYVYLNPDKKYEHVLVATQDRNVFLVVIVDLVEVKIYGHYLLDLTELYGLTEL